MNDKPDVAEHSGSTDCSARRMKHCTCETCGRKFWEKKHRPGRFCCRECYSKSLPAAPQPVVCEGCGDTFQPKDNVGRRFCSVDCYRAHATGERHSCYQRNAGMTECLHCEKSFRITGSYEGRQFCSADCWREYQAEHPKNGKAQCFECGEEFKRKTAGQVCCGWECQSKHFTAENSATWKGGEYETSDDVIHVYTGKKRKAGKTAGRIVYKRQHRLVVEKAIGRELFAEERVWHIDRDRGNNRLDNLYIFKCQSEMTKAINRNELPTRSNIVTHDRA